MSRHRLLLAASCLLGFIGAAANGQDVDSDGCWEATQCVKGAAVRIGGTSGIFTTFDNICAKRVFIKACNEAPDWSSEGHCGEGGILPGQALAIPTREDKKPTGRYSWNFVGSTIPENDRLCAGKVDGWNDPMFGR